MQWEPVIGLEIHTQLATKSKIFSGASTAFGAEPNTQACAIDLGLPGVLPVLNLGAVQRAVRFGRAIGAEIAPRSVFARKNYFYPDLPKGYQISQYELPVVGRGKVEIVLDDGRVKCVGVTRAHLEEDAGKSLHEDLSSGQSGMTGIDLNRAGTPLLEIVSEPDMRSPEEAVAYARKIHQLVRWIGISDGNMQEGSFRVDANISLRPSGAEAFGTRAEIKNINSFRFLQKAIEFEIERQADILEDGGKVRQETRLYDANKDETRSMRGKEEANDYRYFPDPDLLPLEIDDAFIDAATVDLPELPDAMRRRFSAQYGLTDYDAALLTASLPMAIYFERVAAQCEDAKLAANWVNGTLAAALNRDDRDIADSPVTADQLAGLLARIQDDTLSGKIAKQVFDALWAGEGGGNADAVIEARGLKQITDSSAIEQMIDAIILANPTQVEQYRAGKDKLFGFFVGQVMQQSQGKANPQQVNQLLKQKLTSG
ncbi:MAG TPA: Asp-tRNA(Asn)/Glu-tRNA(Gln) amidotransferase subunit GatB [Chromatiaceae bacterium]|jgi:aspartyl-tRNA(Asn)/glutamyl-tRNA(Gln) amidotransferase subunit B|nr:MAG: glutamyl-tRNA amidotransferase subunit B [Thiohalocapsa sp. PB-PSB1]QQO52877.1 MAG: Asp-tRNA(Asn)/Glu-tRNA(Gln) amidotransferase subunit GatB [Thiohalocapsa sp. PB-PSB1]HBG94380.1 Asp-tRNA(Asn)/Glu-tRNA(Gln) amidotransferase subunit GatB [Chromatiaceae bacterium]HCS88535.1 Asp-tRNA(Asn)/Glu-tRNA(Gln) amidotransferase subunit GatB [Chromatiaceae bacterium]